MRLAPRRPKRLSLKMRAAGEAKPAEGDGASKKKAPTARKNKAAAGTDQAGKAQVADEANCAGKAQGQAASDSSEDSKSQAPAKRRRSRSRKAPAAPTAPDDFIRAEVAASGQERHGRC